MHVQLVQQCEGCLFLLVPNFIKAPDTMTKTRHWLVYRLNLIQLKTHTHFCKYLCAYSHPCFKQCNWNIHSGIKYIILAVNPARQSVKPRFNSPTAPALNTPGTSRVPRLKGVMISFLLSDFRRWNVRVRYKKGSSRNVSRRVCLLSLQRVFTASHSAKG